MKLITTDQYEIYRQEESLNYLLDLLHKSGFEFEFKIVDGSNQIKAE